MKVNHICHVDTDVCDLYTCFTSLFVPIII